jgi:Uma2 family endonuclease
MIQRMATLLQSPTNALSIADVGKIYHQLAEDLGQLVLKTEGFSVEDYFSLDGNYLVEYVDGCLQVLPMPDAVHQALVLIFANLLIAYSKADPKARTKFSPFKVFLDDSRYREPDICFMKGDHADRRNSKFWIGADLVAEVVSESNRDHDYETKRVDYANAGIPEYWIIDPDQNRIHIYRLEETKYILHGDSGAGTIATSPTLPGFTVNVTDLFQQAAEQA